jgi:L-iditol 2-dehydrogenase
MKSAWLTGLRTLEVRDEPDPRPVHDTDVLLRMERVGVCGSDVHYFATGRIGGQVVEYPYRIGHECGAVVEEVGAAVTRVRAGDRVAVDPARSCGTCDQCRAGRRHTCRHLLFLGTPGQGPGCLCERLVMPQECCFPVAADFSADRAALIEPLSIGAYAVQLADRPLHGRRTAILGAGPIGLSVLLAARDRGGESVYMTDRLDYRLAAARRAGANWTGNPDREDVVAAIAQREPLLLDVVWECCGRQEALDQAVALLKPGGTLVLVGIPEAKKVSFAIEELRRREIRLQNVRRQNECMPAALALAARQGDKLDAMVTHHYPLDRVQSAFETVLNYDDQVVKAMIDFC